MTHRELLEEGFVATLEEVQLGIIQIGIVGLVHLAVPLTHLLKPMVDKRVVGASAPKQPNE